MTSLARRRPALFQQITYLVVDRKIPKSLRKSLRFSLRIDLSAHCPRRLLKLPVSQRGPSLNPSPIRRSTFTLQASKVTKMAEQPSSETQRNIAEDGKGHAQSASEYVVWAKDGSNKAVVRRTEDLLKQLTKSARIFSYTDRDGNVRLWTVNNVTASQVDTIIERDDGVDSVDRNVSEDVGYAVD